MPIAQRRSFPALPLLLILGGLLTASQVSGQTTITRRVISSGGGTTASPTHIMRGTLSQTAAGKLGRPNSNRHDVGFWYWAYRPDVVTRVSIPDLQAESGTRLTVPLHLSISETATPFVPRPFRARVRFNHTLLFPVGSTPGCEYNGDACTIEINGVAEENDSVIAELDFIATLGNSEATPLVIEEFEWQHIPEERIVVVRDDGAFQLLGVCREGDQVRLIRSAPLASRIRVWPNPAAGSTTMEYVSAQEGKVAIQIVDLLGNTVATLAEAEVEATRLYRSEIDLSGIATGSYFVVYTTPTQRLTQQLLITQ